MLKYTLYQPITLLVKPGLIDLVSLIKKQSFNTDIIKSHKNNSD